MVPFDEDNYMSFMKTAVRGWLRNNVSGGHISGYQGKRIHYYQAINPEAEACVVIVHGFCEFFGRYHELAYNLYENGYSVFFIEQRGHGRSWRPSKELDMVDVADFREYVEDLKEFLQTIVRPQTDKQKLFLFAHSMGGAVGALFLEQYPDFFDAAILTSPMLKLQADGLELLRIRLLLEGMHLAGMDLRPLPGSSAFDYKPDFENSGALSRPRFDYQFEQRTDPRSKERYTMNRPSCRWLRAALRATDRLIKNASKVSIPILICQAGKDDYVDNAGQDRFLCLCPSAFLKRFPEAKHEIFYSSGKILEDYYDAVFSFLKSQA